MCEINTDIVSDWNHEFNSESNIQVLDQTSLKNILLTCYTYMDNVVLKLVAVLFPENSPVISDNKGYTILDSSNSSQLCV